MPEVLRVRCPVCGQLTDQDRMFEVQDTAPQVRLFIQKFGGKVKVPDYDPATTYKKYNRGQNPGRIEYEEVTGSADMSAVKEWFVKRCKQFLGQS